MSASNSKPLAAAQPGVVQSIRRLLVEHAASHWLRYLLALGLMAIAAGATGLVAYLVKDVINAAYADKNLQVMTYIGIATAAIFMVKAIAAYYGAVQLAKIGYSIIAENQRRMFRRIIRQNLSFFADRHSTEFLARVTAGSNAASLMLNLIFTAFGRDLLSLIFLVGVMVYQDPVMSFFSFVVVPPAFVMLRKMIRRIYRIARDQFTGGTRIL